MSMIERLSHLFSKYDAEHERLLEFIRREGLNALVPDEQGIDHADETRPE